MEPGFRLCFIVLLLFVVAAAVWGPWWLAAGEGAFVVLLFFIFRSYMGKRRWDVQRYIAGLSQNMGVSMGETALSVPLPMVVIKLETGEILWANDSFYQASSARDHLFEEKIGDIVPGFVPKFLLEGKDQHPLEIAMGNRQYKVFGSLIPVGAESKTPMAALYLVDVTDASQLRRKYFRTRPVVAVIVLDNYEEAMKNLGDSQKSALVAAIDNLIGAWAGPAGGILRKYDRDRYLFIFEERNLTAFVEGKFSLLDTAHTLVSPNSIPVSLSIGIGKEGASLSECFSYAVLAIEMSLSRGGDQAVVKNRAAFEFYGGRAREMEKRTKVKSRVMANALVRLITDSSNVLIMGHRNSDIDSVGAAVGIAAATRKKDRRAYILIEREHTAAEKLLARLEAMPNNEELFITPQQALLLCNRDTLLVIVDVNRPEIVESPELLNICGRVAVVDHHRRAADYIKKAVLNFHEPSASSASELVTELLQYILEPSDLKRVEAEALLAGIALDTKNFTMHSGARAFEAAAYLCSAGADTVEIKRLFQTDFKNSLARYDVVRSARMYKSQTAIAVSNHTIDRMVASQAADELLTIDGVDASFVLFPQGGQIVLSARSLGRINVHLIVEKLGGGGHRTIAGAQMSGDRVEPALNRLLRAIDLYLEENTA